jgi:hypothetical protein
MLMKEVFDLKRQQVISKNNRKRLWK